MINIVFVLLTLLLGEIVLFAGVVLLSFICEVIEEYRLIPRPRPKK